MALPEGRIVSGDAPKFLATVGAPSDEEQPDEEQLDMLDMWGEPETEAGRQLLAQRGRGRPPGSKNRRTLRIERAAAWLLTRYPDPCERLLALGTMNVADLAALLGCSMFEAAQEQRLSLAAVMPYVKQRQPLAIDVRNSKLVYLTINEGGQASLEAADGMGLTADIVEGVEFERIEQADAPNDGAPDAS